MNTPKFRRAVRAGVAAMAVAAALWAAGPARAAGAASASVVGRTLHIKGTGGPDNIALALADPNLLLIRLTDGTVEQFDRGTFDSIDVALEGGGDHFNGNGLAISQPSTIDGDGGDDSITGTGAGDVIDGGGGDDTILAGAGDDVITGGGGRDFVVGGVGHDTAFLGGGTDTFLWNPGEGSDDVHGGGGTDTLLFNGANIGETMSLSAAGPVAVFLRSPGNVVMNNDGVEILDLHALGGADLITVNDTTGTDMGEADIDLSAAGDGGAGDTLADLVTVNGTSGDDAVDVVGHGTTVDVSGLQPETHITGADPTDQLQVDTLDGNDTVTVDPSANALIGVTVDLGPGQH